MSDNLSPEFRAELNALNQTVEHLKLKALTEDVYRTAELFKEATDGPWPGRHLVAARWGDYNRALRAHSDYLVELHLKENQK